MALWSPLGLAGGEALLMGADAAIRRTKRLAGVRCCLVGQMTGAGVVADRLPEAEIAGC